MPIKEIKKNLSRGPRIASIIGRFPLLVGLLPVLFLFVLQVCLIGFTAGIPDSVMGITFLAAGTSIPDAMASLIVARQGK